MRSSIRSLSRALFLLLLCGCGRSVQFEEADLVIRHINVVDVVTGTVLANHAIAVSYTHLTLPTSDLV